MLKPDEMVEVLLLGQKERMKEYVDALHELALLHIREPGTGDGVFQQGVPEPEAGKHSELITKLRIVLERVKIDADKKPAGQVEESAVEKNMDTIESIIHGTGISLIESTDRKEKLNDEIKRVEQHLSAIEEIRKLGLELGDFGPYEHIGVITGFCDSTLEQKFRDVNWVKITRAPRKTRSTAFALFYPNEKEKELRDLIAGLQIREVKKFFRQRFVFPIVFHIVHLRLIAQNICLCILDIALKTVNVRLGFLHFCL
jgi:vacuolar-type H+-ATPase subunit I/STV1